WLLHDGPRKRSHVLDFLLGGMGVVLLTFWVLALEGSPMEGLRIFYEHTFAFQGERETPWSIFAQVPELRVLQLPLTLLAGLLAIVVAVLPKRWSIRRLAAFSAALIIAFELTVNYWFYPYVTWFEPFVFAALLLATNEKSALDRESERPPSSSGQHKPVQGAAHHKPSTPSETEQAPDSEQSR
ncbi:MAG: hypothetical protein LC781_09975, partial [Actinobacteria bacterium]|nr:hypothetical protein [Actinomycetota bacterium]